MRSAREAYCKTYEINVKKKQRLMEQANAFVDVECENAARAAIYRGQYYAIVLIPQHQKEIAPYVSTILNELGYHSKRNTLGNGNVQVCFNWDENHNEDDDD